MAVARDAAAVSRAHRNEATLEPIGGVAHLLSDRLRRRGSFVEILFCLCVLLMRLWKTHMRVCARILYVSLSCAMCVCVRTLS